MRGRILLASTLAMTLLALTQSAWGWSNGEHYSTDPSNPYYGTHDWIAERALDWLPANERALILTYRPAYLYGTELPDNDNAVDGIGDAPCCHHFYFWSNETVQDDIAGRRAMDMQNRAFANLTAGNYADAAKWTGAMTHYIDDLAVFAHVMGENTNWGEETHHGDYEDHVEALTNSPDATLIPLVFDGFLAATSAYNATLALAYDTTFDNSGARQNAVWMDQHYNWSDPVFRDRAYKSINLAVNIVAEAVHAVWSAVAATLPAPKITAVEYPSTVALGQWATITLRATNDGASAAHQWLHISFPDNPSASNIQISSSDLGSYPRLYPSGSSLGATYGTGRINSSYPMVEGSAEPWNSGESHYLQVKVRPDRAGVSTFYVKTGAADDNWKVQAYDPSSGTRDQQNEYVYTYTITVVTTTTTNQQQTITTTTQQPTTITTTQQHATTTTQQQTTTWTSQQHTTTVATQTTPVQTSGIGFAFAVIGIGTGAAVVAVGVALAVSGPQRSEVYAYGGYYYCRNHRVPLWSVQGRLWCPIERRHLRL